MNLSIPHFRIRNVTDLLIEASRELSIPHFRIPLGVFLSKHIPTLSIPHFRIQCSSTTISVEYLCLSIPHFRILNTNEVKAARSSMSFQFLILGYCSIL